MDSNASTGIGGEANHGIRDLRRVETEPERPTEYPEETNRKSHQLLPVFPSSHTVSA